uniref:PCI domain-containing protein n=1 Tax=Ditylenchus dipsaci TaxID=166011 RepID=A0A915D1N4_9BILA
MGVRALRDCLRESILLMDDISNPDEVVEEVIEEKEKLSRDRELSIINYCQPFLNIDINRMAADFNKSVDETLEELVALIEKGLLNARIDNCTKVLHLDVEDSRSAIHQNATSLRRHLKERVYATMLRAALQSQKICIGYSERSDGRGRNAFQMNSD